MALTNNQIAQIIVDDMSVLGLDPPFDAIDKAEYWVGRGKTHMRERSRYNPDLYADGMGLEVLIEYTKSRLQGQFPDANPGFIQMFGVWQKQAAISYHGSYDACIEAQSGDEDALTSTITFAIPIPVPTSLTSTAETELYNTYKNVGRPVENNQFAGWGVVFLDVDSGTTPVETELEKKYIIESNTATTITFVDHELYYREVYDTTAAEGVMFRIVPN